MKSFIPSIILTFHVVAHVSALQCHECTNNGEIPSDRTCLDTTITPFNTKLVSCDGVCTATRAVAPNGLTVFQRACQPQVGSMGLNSCVKIDAKIVGHTCVCNRDGCNGAPLWDTATLSRTSIKCLSETAIPGSGALDMMTGDAYCSSGSCSDQIVKLPNGDALRSRACSPTPIKGCMDKLPLSFAYEASQMVKVGVTLVKICGCDTQRCNADVNSGTGPTQKNAANTMVASSAFLLFLLPVFMYFR